MASRGGAVTLSEQRIAELAATDQSNREAYRKLDIQTRGGVLT